MDANAFPLLELLLGSGPDMPTGKRCVVALALKKVRYTALVKFPSCEYYGACNQKTDLYELKDFSPNSSKIKQFELHHIYLYCFMLFYNGFSHTK